MNLENLPTQENLENTNSATITELVKIKTNQADLYVPPKKHLTYKYIQQNTINQNGQFLSLMVDIETFKQYGLGIYLYFDFLKKVTTIMLVMSIIALVACYFNFNGNGLDKYGQARSNFLLLSLANQPEYIFICTNNTGQSNPNNTSQLCQNTDINNATLNAFVNSSSSRLLQISIPDFIYSGLFLIFLFYWNFRSKNIIKEYYTKTVTPSKFTLQVNLKNQNIRIENQQIFNHFNKLGEVISVQSVYNYQGIMYEMKKMGSIIKQVKKNKALRAIKLFNGKQKSTEQKNYNKSLQQLNKIINQSSKTLLNHRLKLFKAYVMFNTTQSANNVFNMYQKYQVPLMQKICCFFCLQSKPQHLLFLKQMDLFQVSKCKIQPSDILWENLDVSKIQFFSRGLLTFLISLLTFLLTFIIIICISLLSPNTNKTTNLVYTPTFQQAVTSQDRVYIDTFCLSQSLSELIGNSKIYNFCKDSIQRYYLQISLNQIISLVIVLANVALSKLINKLSHFRRFRSKSELAYEISLSQMFAIIINTSLLYVLLQADIFNFVPTQPAYNVLKNSEISKFITTYPIYTDFSRQWYIDVGIKLTSMWLINIIVPHLFLILLSPITKWYRQWRASIAQLQIQANKIVLGSQFDLSYYYSFMLYTITVSLIFCGPLPYFLIFGTLSLFVLYFSSKFHLLRICKKPPNYSQVLNKLIFTVLPISLMIHLLISMYCYSLENIFPSSQSSFKIDLDHTLSNIGLSGNSIKTNNIAFDAIMRRLQKVIYLLIFLVVLLFGYIFKKLIVNGFNKLNQYCCENRVHNIRIQSYIYDEQITKIKKKMIKDYSLQNNPDYEQIDIALHVINSLKKNINNL